VIRARLVSRQQVASARDAATLLDRAQLAPKLTVRNWRPGDRFFPAKTKAPKKLKDLLEPGRVLRHISPAERKSWPVVESAGRIVWVRGFPAPEALASITGDQQAVLIEESEL
jgi:tRNA(Ile)-lysidine synthase